MRESHLAKAGTKLPNSGPPTTPMEKYKLRVAIGKLTGRLDLACKAVWPVEDASTHTHSAATAVQVAGTASEPSSAEAAGDGGDTAVFLTQESEADASPGEEESLEGIFDQVADSRIGSTAEEEAALVEGDGTEDPAAANPKKKAKEMVLDFRLSVLPKEIVRISGISTSSNTGFIIMLYSLMIRVLLVNRVD